MTRQEKISRFEKAICTDYPNIAGIVILKDGKKQYENYMHACTATDPIHVCSVTKSIVSILVGIAIDRGYIRSVDQPVLHFFPDYPVKRDEKVIYAVTIRHLLCMTVPFKFRSPPYTRFFSSNDWVKASLDLLGGKAPVGQFRYMEMIGPDILSGVLVNATGRPVLAFAQEYLFSPLGIDVPSNILLDTEAQHIAFFKAHHASGWVADACGNNTAGWGLMLTALDMAKIGLLYLDGGKWAGRQIVPEAWVRESTAEHSHWQEANLAYGYLWWTGIGSGYAAIGNGGNVIYVNPEKRLVIAITSLLDPASRDIIALITRQIEPAWD
nr:serine hydrolase [Maliibacterium massiliense]